MTASEMNLSEEKKDETELYLNKDDSDPICVNPTSKGRPELDPSLRITSDPALGHISRAMDFSKPRSNAKQTPTILRMAGTMLRVLVVDIPLVLLFAALLGILILRRVHDNYLYKQITLMRFQYEGRDFTEATYYHRVCDGRDVSATSVDQLLIRENTTGKEAADHIMKHGASLYPNLLTLETAHQLREYIVKENLVQEGYSVIENEHRYSWGININGHPALKTFWKELISNDVLVDALHEIVGPDPAIIEFTAITAAYGAKDQHDHHDVVADASATKYAHSFATSYSLFIPLQDTSYDMGATHVCPGTHLCGEGAMESCPAHNLAMSGEQDNWPTGWGALVNQQTVHKGMGHTKKGGLDRVVIIATFAPRPFTPRGLETRMIGQGGSYSILWSQWGHTFSDFVFADRRMTEVQKTMRAFGLLKGNGWNLITLASMRMANDDTGYNMDDGPTEFMEKKGGFAFLPKSWQGAIEGDNTGVLENAWYSFLIGTVKRTEKGLKFLSKLVFATYFVVLLLADIIWRWIRPSQGSLMARSLRRLFWTHGLVALAAFLIIRTIDESNWAKDIASGKASRLPEFPLEHFTFPGYSSPATIPTELDILIAPHYASEHLAGYGRVLDLAHPGNVFWRSLVDEFSSDYMSLSESLQDEFCKSIIEYTRQWRRFLTQGEQREWIEVASAKEQLNYCHKEMVTAASPVLPRLVRALNSLRTATKIGRFSNTAMSQKTTPRYLDEWETKLISPRTVPRPLNKQKKSTRLLFGSKSALEAPKTVPRMVREYSVPRSGSPTEPFPLAWVKEGDIVEAMYQCAYNAWYRGKVALVVANVALFDIEYFDGDVNEGLARPCIRPYKPFEVGEYVEVNWEDDGWLSGQIVKAHHDDNGEPLFDIEVQDYILYNVAIHLLRRVSEALQFELGEQVWARFGGSDNFFPGQIEGVNSDGTYAVLYSDGDFDANVPAIWLQKEFGNPDLDLEEEM